MVSQTKQHAIRAWLRDGCGSLMIDAHFVLMLHGAHFSWIVYNADVSGPLEWVVDPMDSPIAAVLAAKAARVHARLSHAFRCQNIHS